MKNNYKIIPIFPIPIFTIQVPSSFSNIIPLFNQQKIKNNPLGLNSNFGQRSDNSYILNESSFLALSTYILDKATIYCKEVLNYNYKEYILSQSWISYKHPGDQHHPHTHSNSLISGVFYYEGNFKDQSSSINFSNTFLIESPTKPKYLSTRNQFSIPYFSLTPNPGMLILFPSSLPHSVPLNTTDKIRKSLAFNIVPKEGLGDEESLTELKFN